MRHTKEDYVCPRCFCQIEDCTCDLQPQELIQIDRGLQGIIKIFNDKGYNTCYCCEGHFNGEKKNDLYIMFLYPPADCPQGWIREGRDGKDRIVYRCIIKSGSKFVEKRKQHFDEEKEKALKAMLDFALGLPKKRNACTS